MHLTSVDLNALIRATVRMLARLIGEDIRLVIDLQDLPGPVRADPGQFEMVLVNLAVNARDAMPGGGTLTVRTRVMIVADGDGDLPAGDYALMTVIDTGTGIEPDVRARIFEPFFTTKEPGKGTGLGLATVHGIMQQGGGRIRVGAGPGPGATFEVFLPIAASGVDAPSPVERTQRRSGDGAGVLVVEDDRAVLSLSCRILERAGYRVFVATSSTAEAVFERNQASIAVLLSDVVMPDLDGPTIASRLRAVRPALNGRNES